ncbi:MAG: hypothetical protein VX519_08485 [Myxococcota bacterium]|nr:hypothetical protein [Myxococcota bacterium]
MSSIDRVYRLSGIALVGAVACQAPPMDGRLTDANNYVFSGALEVPSVTTASGVDVDVCWDGVRTDIQCRDMDPVADIDNLSLVRFPHMDQASVEAGMSDSTLQQADISGYVESRTDSETCGSLSDMSFFGTTIDVTEQYVSGAGTYLLLLTTGTEPAVGSRMLVFIDPDVDSTNTSVEVPDGCGVLDFSVDLKSLEPLLLPTEGPWVVDWSGVTVDGRGLSSDFGAVDQVTFGFYEGQTLADLESDFLNIESLATQTWSATLESGTSVDLAELSDSMGRFPGFEGVGVWVLALRCERCFNPAPLLLTRVEPR